MNFKKLIVPLFVLIIISACSSTKNVTNDTIFNQTWELEYITGPRITFDGLFPDQKPYLKFDKTTEMATGNASCNGYSSDFKIKGSSLEFGERGISTLMYCGDGEAIFTNMLKDIESYNIDADGKLNLLTNNVTMMRFHKK